MSQKLFAKCLLFVQKCIFFIYLFTYCSYLIMEKKSFPKKYKFPYKICKFTANQSCVDAEICPAVTRILIYYRLQICHFPLSLVVL